MRTCGALAGAELTHPFGVDTAVFKVGGRVFAILTPHEEPPRVTLKCDPDYAILLAQQFDEIVPGYHMNKRHWITVTLSPTTSADLVDELIGVSYDLVVAALSADARSALAGPPGARSRRVSDASPARRPD
ncbi:MAG: MmcQ/YjbR family DNA-binding protein [Acidobacteria bacterium]|nr:MmcQ/YjbR family DNA-binding protein [Acidobacteriota bacterium]